MAEVQNYGENIARLQIQAKSFHLEGTKHARLDKEPEVVLLNITLLGEVYRDRTPGVAHS